MLRRIEQGEANGILAWKLDRLARNFDDGGKIIGLLQRGVIQEIRTFEKTYLPNDNVLMIAVEFGMANQYVRDLSVNIRRGIREKIRRGIFSGKAPLGYVPEECFAEEVKRNAQLVIIPDEWKEKFLAKIETWESEVSHEKQQKIDRLKTEFASLKSKIGRLNDGFYRRLN
jgi:DNA invertase Pin-like site-specific DNA recombinase